MFLNFSDAAYDRLSSYCARSRLDQRFDVLDVVFNDGESLLNALKALLDLAPPAQAGGSGPGVLRARVMLRGTSTGVSF